MIKMYINNEEVVSNKEFTISEEMLATPSTVLNNCYPALWENTKDYVSKFYFPKDYSKCIIGDGEFEKGSQRNIIKKVSGIRPSFETNITKPWESLTIDGKSTQETTSGKNKFVNKPSTLTICGLTMTNDGETITIKGTNTSSSFYPSFIFYADGSVITFEWYGDKSKIDVSKGFFNELGNTYMLSIDKKGSVSPDGLTFNLGLENSIKTVPFYNATEKYKITINDSEKINYVCFGFKPNQVVDLTLKIQLENGSTATEIEPYTGGQPSPSPDYPSEIENVKGKNLFDGEYELGSINFGTGQLETDAKIIRTKNYQSISSNEDYTLTLPNEVTGINVYYYNNESFIKAVSLSLINHVVRFKTPNNSNKVKWRFNTGYVILNNKTQLEKGSVATRYVPYGNIQIVETGKNLADINSIKIGKNWVNGTDPQRASILNIPIEPNTKYTLSGNINSNTHLTTLRVVTFEKLGDIFHTGVFAGVFTTPSNAHYLSIEILADTTITSDMLKNVWVQLEKGSTATDYEPYKEEVVNINLKENELCSLPNGTKDELIVKDGRAKILKRIGKVVLNGSENITKHNSITGRFNIPVTSVFGGAGNPNAISNYYISRYQDVDNSIYVSYANTIQIVDFRFKDDIAIFKTWLSTHNTIVYYALATPYEIDLGEVTLPNTLIGQNNVTLDATLETNMKISYYYSSYDLLFAGVVKKTGNISLNPRYPHYADIQVLDFKTFLSEGETLNFVIDNKTIGQAIDMVIDAIKSYGFVKGNIMLDDINEVIGAYSTDKKTAYDVFQYFSDITNSRWFTRMIDEDTVAIDFYDTDKLPVKPKIEYTEDWFCNNLIDDMSYSIKTDDYRNKQILLSDEVFGSTPYNDLLTSNGYDTSYTTTGKIASLTSAKIDGKNATFTTEANKEGGVEADIYYKPGEVGITTNNQIGAGKVIEITYIPLVEGREIIINDEEVNRIGPQLNRNGVISRYENRNDTTSSDELRQIGQTYIKYKGKAEVTLKITSRKNIYNIGDKVQFDAPLEDLSTEYMVKKKTTKYIVTANQLFYDYELSSSFNSESEINYFDNQRSKHKGNLSEGDYITRDIDITNSANIIWHDTSIDEISITGNNVLDCALDSPFTD